MSDDRPHVPKTFERGPSDPIAFADGAGTYVEATIAASPEKVWSIVTDINLSAEPSEEFKGAEWIGDGPALGASFNGRNENDTLGAWELVSYIDKFEEGRLFGWATADADNPGARWWFTLTPSDEGTHLRYDVVIGPGPSGLSMVIEQMPEKEPRIISGRLRQLHTNMVRTLEVVQARL